MKSRTLAGIAAIALLCLAVMPTTGCSGVSVAQDIVNWTPTLESAVATVNSTAALLAPADATIFAAATVGFDALQNALDIQAKAYLANPSATVLAKLQTAVVTFQQQVNDSLLAVAGIKDTASQKHALAAIQAVATVVSAMLALVASISSKAAVARMASQETVKLAEVEPYELMMPAADMVAAHYGLDQTHGLSTMLAGEQRLEAAGF
jgi:hypothetical protein